MKLSNWYRVKNIVYGKGRLDGDTGDAVAQEPIYRLVHLTIRTIIYRVEDQRALVSRVHVRPVKYSKRYLRARLID